MRRWVWIATVLAGFGTAGVIAARTRASAAEDAVPVKPSAAPPRRAAETVVKATGVIKPRVGAEVRVGARISGVVKRLYVQVGDSVERGQLLAELDDRDFVARRDEAAATLKQLEAELAYANADRKRKRTLAGAGAITTADLDAVEKTSTVGEAQVDAARANLAFAAAQVEYTRITAPIAGVVSSVATQEGETVAASFAAPTFLTLLDPSRLAGGAYVDETDIGRVHAGQAARFTVDTYGDHEFEGRVTAVYPSAEIRDNVVNYITVVRFQQPRGYILRPEMTTTVRIALQGEKP